MGYVLGFNDYRSGRDVVCDDYGNDYYLLCYALYAFVVVMIYYVENKKRHVYCYQL